MKAPLSKTVPLSKITPLSKPALSGIITLMISQITGGTTPGTLLPSSVSLHGTMEITTMSSTATMEACTYGTLHTGALVMSGTGT